MAMDKVMKELMTDEERREHEQQEKAKAIFISDMRDLFRDTRAQKLLFHILDLSNINGLNYTGETNSTNYNLGRTAVGYGLLELMEEADPTLYPRLLLQHAKER